ASSVVSTTFHHCHRHHHRLDRRHELTEESDAILRPQRAFESSEKALLSYSEDQEQSCNHRRSWHSAPCSPVQSSFLCLQQIFQPEEDGNSEQLKKQVIGSADDMLLFYRNGSTAKRRLQSTRIRLQQISNRNPLKLSSSKDDNNNRCAKRACHLNLNCAAKSIDIDYYTHNNNYQGLQLNETFGFSANIDAEHNSTKNKRKRTVFTRYNRNNRITVSDDNTDNNTNGCDARIGEYGNYSNNGAMSATDHLAYDALDLTVDQFGDQRQQSQFAEDLMSDEDNLYTDDIDKEQFTPDDEYLDNGEYGGHNHHQRQTCSLCGCILSSSASLLRSHMNTVHGIVSPIEQVAATITTTLSKHSDCSDFDYSLCLNRSISRDDDGGGSDSCLASYRGHKSDMDIYTNDQDGHIKTPDNCDIYSSAHEDYCEVCQKHFCNKYYLRKHKADVHGIYTDYVRPAKTLSNIFLKSPTGKQFQPAKSPTPLLAEHSSTYHQMPQNPGNGILLMNPYFGDLILHQDQIAMTHSSTEQCRSSSPPEACSFPSTAVTTSTADTKRLSNSTEANNIHRVLQRASALCTTCKKDFFDEESLQMHILNFHSDQISLKEEEAGVEGSNGSFHSYPTAATIVGEGYDDSMDDDDEEYDKSDDATICDDSIDNINTDPMTTRANEFDEEIPQCLSKNLNKISMPFASSPTKLINNKDLSYSTDGSYSGAITAATNSHHSSIDDTSKNNSTINSVRLQNSNSRSHRQDDTGDNDDLNSGDTFHLQPEVNNHCSIGCDIDDNKPYSATSSDNLTAFSLAHNRVNTTDYDHFKVEPTTKYFLSGTQVEESSQATVMNLAMNDNRMNLSPASSAMCSTGQSYSSPTMLSTATNVYGVDNSQLNLNNKLIYHQHQQQHHHNQKPEQHHQQYSPGNSNSHAKLSERVVCDICNKQVCNKYFLKTHKTRVHGVFFEKQPAGETGNNSNTSTSYSTILSNHQYHDPSRKFSSTAPNSSSVVGKQHNRQTNSCSPIFKEEFSYDESHNATSGGSSSVGVIGCVGLVEATTGGGATSSVSQSSSQDDLQDYYHNPMSEQERNELLMNNIDPDAYCILCKKEFCSKYFLRTHQQNIHKVIKQIPSPALSPAATVTNKKPQCLMRKEPSAKTKSQSPAQTRVTCKICNKELCNKYFLRSHMMNVHNIFAEESLPSQQQVKREHDDISRDVKLEAVIDHQTTTSHRLMQQQHHDYMQLHHHQYQENQENPQVSSSREYGEHFNNNTTAACGQFRCPICGDHLNSQDEYNEHSKNVHGIATSSALVATAAKRSFNNTTTLAGDLFSEFLSPPKCKEGRPNFPGFSGMQPFIFESDDTRFADHFVPCMVYLPIKSRVHSTVSFNLRLKPVGHEAVFQNSR
ncbi:hypothetical protein GJ496_001164, partial [Pomphorhynchus laevis]